LGFMIGLLAEGKVTINLVDDFHDVLVISCFNVIYLIVSCARPIFRPHKNADFCFRLQRK